MKPMIAIATALILTGCAAQTAPTVTVTATPAPVKTSAPAPVTSSDDEFDAYMEYLGTDSVFMNDPSMLQTMRDLGRNTCDMLDSGFTTSEILMLAAESLSDADDSTLEAASFAMVAGTYAYCPEWSGAW